MIHAPSLGIGAGISAAVIVGIFFALNGMPSVGFNVDDIKPAETEQHTETKLVKMSLFTDNSSPILGDANAPITIVEFGDSMFLL